MAATTTVFSHPACAPAVAVTRPRVNRRRRITPEAGCALEKLAHAIEYLTDEFIEQGLAFSARDEQLQAVQTLMALNRQIYFECPEAPTFSERCRSLFHRRTQ